MGALNRRVGIATRDGEARAAVEDDLHHFRVIVRHDGSAVTAAKSQTLRRPWTSCALAGERLTELIGAKLTPRAAAVAGYADPIQQCTHMFDLASLAIAAAARGIASRRYYAIVPDLVDARTTPRLQCDGAEVLHWELNDSMIENPPPYAGRSLRKGFSKWVDENLSVEDAEAAFVLRRAVLVSGGRRIDLDTLPHAPMARSCFVQQPERAPLAKRMLGATIDFADHPGDVLQEDEAWLAFADKTEDA